MGWEIHLPEASGDVETSLLEDVVVLEGEEDSVEGAEVVVLRDATTAENQGISLENALTQQLTIAISLVINVEVGVI